MKFCPFAFTLRVLTDNSAFNKEQTNGLIKGTLHLTALSTFFETIKRNRRSLVQALSTVHTADDEMQQALKQYIARIRCLEGVPENTMFVFKWTDVFCANQYIILHSVRFEIVSVLFSTALWKCCRAASLITSAEEGASSAAVGLAVRYYQEALGLLECCKRQLTEAELAAIDDLNDLHPSVLEGIYVFVSAEHQAISVLRAIEKGNSSSLVSSLAGFAQVKYVKAGDTLEQNGKSGYEGSLLKQIVENAFYKAASFEALALAYAGDHYLANEQAGIAVGFVRRAEKALLKADLSSEMSNKNLPSRLLAQRNNFNTEYSAMVMTIKNKVETENESVYYKTEPAKLPNLPPGREAISVTEFVLPEKTPSLKSVISDGLIKKSSAAVCPLIVVSDPSQNRESLRLKKGNQSCIWCRWPLLLFLLPCSLLLTLVGIIAWVMLLPFRFFCPTAVYVGQLLVKIVDYYIKAPVRCIRWTLGKF